MSDGERLVRQIARRGQPSSPPRVFLYGGETTVTMCGHDRGGRNVKFLPSLGNALDGLEGVWIPAGDTDGVDGLEEIAGAVPSPGSLARAWRLGLRPKDELVNNNRAGFFGVLGNAVVIGPTFASVDDFRAVVIAPETTDSHRMCRRSGVLTVGARYEDGLAVVRDVPQGHEMK